MDNFIERTEDSDNLRRLIGQFPITLLTGPRQCGKTTLARRLNPDHCLSLTSQIPTSGELDTLLSGLDSASGLVMLDDVDHCPDVFSRIRQVVDSHQNVRFLLLGSAFLPTLSEISRHLMGRFAQYELGGLTLADVGPEEPLSTLVQRGNASIVSVAG